MAKPRRKPYVPTVPPAWAESERQNDATEYQFNTRTAENGSRVPGRERRLHVRAIPGITAEEERVASMLAGLWEARERSPERNGVFVDNTPDWSAIALRQIEAQTEWAKAWAAVPRWGQSAVMHVCVLNRPVSGVTWVEDPGRLVRLALRVMLREGW